jgi:hypothetical protein
MKTVSLENYFHPALHYSNIPSASPEFWILTSEFCVFPNSQFAIPARHREPARSGEAGGRNPKFAILSLSSGFRLSYEL